MIRWGCVRAIPTSRYVHNRAGYFQVLRIEDRKKDNSQIK